MSKIINLDTLKLKNLKPNFQGSHSIYNFILDDKFYYFKKTPIRELVMEFVSMKIAGHLGIPYLNEKVAILDDDIGLLSESYLRDNESSYPLLTLIKYYFYNNQEEEEFFDYQNQCRLNNLEDIWFALEEKYPSDVVLKLMNGICDIFLFDILLGESDRTLKNIEIIEGKYDVRLAPIYDTSSIFQDKVLLGVDKEDFLQQDILTLNKFLDVSDSYYLNRFYSFLDSLETVNISSILTEIAEIGVPISLELQNEITSNFQHRFQTLKECKRVSITK